MHKFSRNIESIKMRANLERAHTVGQQTHRVEHVARYERLEHVELQVAVGAAYGARHVVAHDLDEFQDE